MLRAVSAAYVAVPPSTTRRSSSRSTGTCPRRRYSTVPRSSDELKGLAAIPTAAETAPATATRSGHASTTPAEPAATGTPIWRPLRPFGWSSVLGHIVGRRLDDDPTVVAFAFRMCRHELVGSQRQVHDASLTRNHRVELDLLAITH